MKIYTTIKEYKQARAAWRREEKQVGFVPTMGYLHDGHGALIQRATEENDAVVVSIFVNPLQFGPNEDFARYPRDLERDLAFCEKLGAAAVFAPTVKEMYGDTGVLTTVHVAQLGEHLCGKSRPGHFDGVTTVVSKLFHIVEPARAYFGKKDYQQWRIVAQMTNDLSLPVEVVPVPIVREPDGLALSSRNAYLNPSERAVAPQLYRSLQQIAEGVSGGDTDLRSLVGFARQTLAAYPQIKIDYYTCVDAATLQPVETIEPGRQVVCAVAAFVGNTRLIDNIELSLT